MEQQFQELCSSHAALQELLHALQYRDETDAAAIFKRLRHGDDAKSIMRHITAGDLLIQLHAVPETRLRYDFPAKIEIPAHILASDNPYLYSLTYEGNFKPQKRPTSLQKAVVSFGDGLASSRYVKPYHAAKLVDPRLDLVRPSNWTSVCDNDDLMRKLLHLYIQYEYQWFTCFHKDQFLDDMLSGSTRFCSSLLVNSVLAQACVSSPG